MRGHEIANRYISYTLTLACIISLLLCLVIVPCVYAGQPVHNDGPWQTDILVFRKILAETVDGVRGPSSPGDMGAETQGNKAVAKFKGKEVIWEITFLGVDDEGRIEFRESLDAHAEGTEKFVSLSMKADPGSLAEWRRLERNSRVKCRARISFIMLSTRWSASQRFAGWFPMVLLEDTKFAVKTIKVAAFNIQIFGKTKRSKADVMDVLVKIAREFDVMLVQEIRDASETTAQTYLDAINAEDGPDYAFVRSERLGRTSSKEAYAYFYNTDTVEFITGSDYVHDDMADGEDEFEREPYIASFRSGNFDFTLAGIHIKPDDAEAEIGELEYVYTTTLAKDPDEHDIILMGDFNADGSYFDEDGASPLKTGDFSWVITNDMDTMTKTDWTYDRIVMTDATVEYVDNSAAVFYFDQEYGIADQELVKAVSDHYPVYGVFRTDMVDDD